MNNLPFSPVVLGVLAAAFVIGSLLLMRGLDQQEKVKARLVRVANPQLPALSDAAGENKNAGGAVDIVAQIGSSLARSGLLPAATRAEFEQTLAQAGWRGGQGLGLFVGCKVIGVVLMPLLAYGAVGRGEVSPLTFYMVMAFALITGLLAPDFVLRQMRQAHLRKVEKGLPD